MFHQRFFGTVRHTAGSNDHPGTPTFLQIYKILSIFSVIKPPRYGNCTLLHAKYETAVTISDIKDLYYDPDQKEASRNKLKKKLDNAIENSDFQFQHFMDHDYSRPEILDCVIYYVTGYLSKHILKFIKCETCKDAFINPGQQNSFITALLTNIKKEGQILHPNTNIFYIIKHLENLFTKYCYSTDVYDLVIEDIYTPSLIFPCKEHGDKVLAQIIEFYLKFRMRAYVNKINNEKKKMNQKIKKNARFYKT